jgi:molecular chaperone HscC
VSQGHFDPVIERNTPVPVSRSKSYVPMREGQTKLELQIYQGEARLVRDNIHLGVLNVPLPLAAVQDCAVDVRFTYDVNGLLEVQATVARTGETFSVVIEGNPGVMTEEEITERLKALADLKIHPRDRLENRTLTARAERLYEQCRGDEREWLGVAILKFEQVLASQDDRRIAAARREFEGVLERVERNSYLDGGPRL